MLHYIRSYFILIAATMMLAACDPAPSGEVGPSLDGVDLRGSAIGGDFLLTSNEGKPVRWADFTGQYRMVYFGFAYCPDICPTDVARSSAGLAIFEKSYPDLGAKIQPIFITVDPERDDVATIGEFVDNFHPRLIGLTGSQEAIDTALEAFKVTAIKMPETEAGNYDFEHSTFTYLFDPDGKPLGIIPTDKGPNGVVAELERWVR
ncbi:SCO family protein [Altererythrobacter gangjinensis]|uniref:SCO family protein n=2 Tax=Pontixanthobacter gangjinensis TaxID=1028742 RepID=A0A6I4SSD5_9SPHN|nr:SCO family protein [Pontixanthobacter gangjinensis]